MYRTCTDLSSTYLTLPLQIYSRRGNLTVRISPGLFGRPINEANSGRAVEIRLQELAGVKARLVDEAFGSVAEEEFAAFGAEVDDAVLSNR